jgi:hypothetical protein
MRSKCVIRKIRKRKVTEREAEGPGGAVSSASGEKRKTVRSKAEHEKTKEQMQEAARQWPQERRHYDDMVVKD